MKKVLVGLLCCMLAVGVISGCGSKEKPKSDKGQNHTEKMCIRDSTRIDLCVMDIDGKVNSTTFPIENEDFGEDVYKRQYQKMEHVSGSN